VRSADHAAMASRQTESRDQRPEQFNR